MRKAGLFFLFLCGGANAAYAQGAAPEMFGVREVVVEYAHLDDAKAANACGISREQVSETLMKALGAGVPAVSAADAKPSALGAARIELIPEISSYNNESLDCVSWISLTAQNRVNIVIPPVQSPRGVTVVYWQQHARLSSGQSFHAQKIDDVLKKMADQFVQQYRLDQPPEIQK